MKTQGEIEAGICEGITRFEQEYMGRGPKDIHAHLIGDLLVVRLQGVLTEAEQQLVKTLPADKGTAVRRLLAAYGSRRALFAGDDTTDLDGFRALDGLELAVRVAVVSGEGPTELPESADVTVDGPEEMLAILRRL